MVLGMIPMNLRRPLHAIHVVWVAAFNLYLDSCMSDTEMVLKRFRYPLAFQQMV